MPKFNERAAHRIPSAVEDAPAEVSDNACRDGEVVIELNQGIVFIERDVIRQRIIRPLRHDGRNGERLGQIAGQRESRRDQRHALEKAAPVDGDVERFRFGFVRFKFHSSHFLFYRPHLTLRAYRLRQH